MSSFLARSIPAVMASRIESGETEAGSIECFKAQISALDGEGGDGTLWIEAAAPRVTVRSAFQLPPAMGGGQDIEELVSPHGQ